MADHAAHHLCVEIEDLGGLCRVALTWGSLLRDTPAKSAAEYQTR
jgi:hypothetical protein